MPSGTDRLRGTGTASSSGTDRLRGISTGGVIAPTVTAPQWELPEIQQSIPWYQWLLGGINMGSVYTTQLMASYERNLEGVRGDRPTQLYLPEFSSPADAALGIYANTDDPGLALTYRASWGGLNPLYMAEREFRGPETVENQFLTSGRAALLDEAPAWLGPAMGAVATARGSIVPGVWELAGNLLAPVPTEQFVSETMNDPLVVFEAFNMGRRIIDGTNIAFGGFRSASPILDRSISLTAEAADVAMGGAMRRVYRAARPFIGEAGFEERMLGLQMGEHQRTIERALGGGRQARAQWLEEIAPGVTDVLEAAPGPRGADVPLTTRTAFEEFGAESAFESAQRIPQISEFYEGVSRERFDFLLDDVRSAFPDVTPEIQDEIVDILSESWMLGGRLPEVERLMGVPTTNLTGDMGYALRMVTREAREARLNSLPAGERAYLQTPEDILGRELTQTTHRRNLRGTIRDYNQMAADGQVGYVNGKLRTVNFGESATIDGWQGVDKLLVDDPIQLLYSRYSMSTRTISASEFLRSMRDNHTLHGTGRDALTIQDVIGNKRTMGRREYEMTFGRLGGDLQEIAEGIKFRDRDTAEGVVHWLQVMQDMNHNTSAIGRMYDHVLTLWRGATLTPFLGYHMRNVVGGLNNVWMSGHADIFDMIDATFPTQGRTGGYWDDFSRGGGSVTGEVYDNWTRGFERARSSPLDGTPIQSHWNEINQYNPFGQGGRTVGQAIESHQRFSLYLGSRRRGLSHDDSMNMMYKYLFDYLDVPPWLAHGTVGRRMAAFPVWTMKNIPLQFEHLLTTPTHFGWRGRYMNISRNAAQESLGPEFVEEGQGFPLAGGGFFRPENFDPAASIGEMIDIARPALQGDLMGSLDEGKKWVLEMLNPFVTEPIEQITPTIPTGAGFGAPVTAQPLSPLADLSRVPEASRTGWDEFRQRPIRRPYTKYNDLLGGGPMPGWVQGADHFMRSFFRAYNQTANGIREVIRTAEGETAYTPAEYGARVGFGIPIFNAKIGQTIYFKLRENEREINSLQNKLDLGDAAPEQLTELKNFYSERLGFLGHGTFLQFDPWTNEPRPWSDISREGEMTIRGLRDRYRDFFQTCYLLLYGRTGMANVQLHEPIPLTPDERGGIEELMMTAIQSYQTIMYERIANEEIDDRSEVQYLDRFMEPPEAE